MSTVDSAAIRAVILALGLTAMVESRLTQIKETDMSDMDRAEHDSYLNDHLADSETRIAVDGDGRYVRMSTQMIHCQAERNGIKCEVGYMSNSDVHETNGSGQLIHRHANLTWMDCEQCGIELNDDEECQMCREAAISERVSLAIAEIDAHAANKAHNVLTAFEAGKCFLWEAIEQLEAIGAERATERASVGWEL